MQATSVQPSRDLFFEGRNTLGLPKVRAEVPGSFGPDQARQTRRRVIRAAPHVSETCRSSTPVHAFWCFSVPLRGGDTSAKPLKSWCCWRGLNSRPLPYQLISSWLLSFNFNNLQFCHFVRLRSAYSSAAYLGARRELLRPSAPPYEGCRSQYLQPGKECWDER